MTLQQLQYFQIMSTTLHYTKAAQLLYTSQPNLSYSLSQLENELGMPLFFKVGKTVFLTEAGRVFKLTVDNIMKILENGISEMKLYNNSTATKIRLGYIQSLSSNLIPSIIKEYYKYKGNNVVEFTFTPNHEANLFEALLNNNLDIIFDGKCHDEVNSVLISYQELNLIAPKQHRFAKMGEINFDELGNENIIMLGENTGLFTTVKQLFKENKTNLNISMIACDYNAALNYIAVGKGVSFLPRTVSIANSNIDLIKIRDVDCKRSIYMTWIATLCEHDSINDFLGLVQNQFLDSF